MRAIVEGGLLIPARLAFDCFVFVLVLFGLGRLRFLSCELCNRSKYQYWIYLRDCETRRSVIVISDDVRIFLLMLIQLVSDKAAVLKYTQLQYTSTTPTPQEGTPS
jgi:hypothetical protein